MAPKFAKNFEKTRTNCARRWSRCGKRWRFTGLTSNCIRAKPRLYVQGSTGQNRDSEFELRPRPLPARRISEAHTVAPGLLGRIKSVVRGFDQLIACSAVLRKCCRSRAHSNRPRHARELPVRNHLSQLLRDADRLIRSSLGQQNRKFLATVTAHHVDLSYLLVKQRRNLSQHFISKHVSKLVVQAFELIDVGHDHRHTRTIPARPLDLLENSQFEKTAVKNSGQAVQVSKLLHPFDVMRILNGGCTNIGH